jgi:hypothetical protein
LNSIDNVGVVYQFVEDLKVEAARCGMTELVIQLEDALRLGSSGLEIIGAIRQITINHLEIIDKMLGSDGRSRAKRVIDFVDNAYGR